MSEAQHMGAVRTARRIAFVVSHPVQYYAPLYQRLAQRDDIVLKVFFTWHAGEKQVNDQGFKIPIAWDVPVTQGYDYELVPNSSSHPGTHHFWGLKNPSLVKRLIDWRPDAVHVTGWAWLSHLVALSALHRRGIRTLFWGDSHLLDPQSSAMRLFIKQIVLRRVYSWPTVCLYVGKANYAYYRAFGVAPSRLYRCPHSIDVARFAEPSQDFQRLATEWRERLRVDSGRIVLLFAGKFERKKRPVELMRAVQKFGDGSIVLLMVGSGELDSEIRAIAASDPDRFRVLPFQNQSVMPIVYRLGDIFVLPSAFGETWGLAVNEAMACGRPVIVSDRVGCAGDLVDESCGRVFPANDMAAMIRALNEMIIFANILPKMRRAAIERAWEFDVRRTETTLVQCLQKICG